MLAFNVLTLERFPAASLRRGVSLLAIIAVGAGLSACVMGGNSGKATPPVAMSSLSADDPMLAAPPSGAGNSTNGSERVPLGALSAPTDSSGSQRVPMGALASNGTSGKPMTSPMASSPPLLIAPKAANTTPSTPSVVTLTPPAAAAPTPMAPPMTQPAAVPAPKTEPAPAKMAAATVADQPPKTTPVTTPPAVAPEPTTPKLKIPPVTSHPDVAMKSPSSDSDSDETVVISSATATPAPVEKSREFIPASLSDATDSDAAANQKLTSMIDRPMSAAEKNVAQRFEVLRRLLDEGLITPEEYARHRNANIGALLPFTHDPGSVGLDRPSASPDAIVARLVALRRALEARAISAQQHASERTMILEALLPATPDDRTESAPPPSDVIQGAAMVSHLQTLRAHNLITSDEFDGERKAIDQYLRTGSFKVPAMAEAKSAPDAGGGKDGKGGKQGAGNGAAGGDMAAIADSDTAEVTGPVLHIASFRNKDGAMKAWQDALGQNKAILSAYHPIIRKIDLGEGKGVFFRLMVGPFASISDAETTCIKLKANNQFCRPSVNGS